MDDKKLWDMEARQYPADLFMTASGAEYKVINSLPVLIGCLSDFVK